MNPPRQPASLRLDPLRPLVVSVGVSSAFVALAVTYAWSEYLDGRFGTVAAIGSVAAALTVIGVGAMALLRVREMTWEMRSVLGERDRVEAALRKSEEYHRIFRQANDAILVLDPADGRVLDVNHRACEVYDIPREMFLGHTLSSITHDTRSMASRLRALVTEGTFQEFETVHFRTDGSPIHLLVNASIIDFQDRRAVLSIHRDITDRKLLERQLAHQAFHDTLTGLANRALFRDRVDHAFARTVRHPQPVIVLFLDLDNFKGVNDTLGHAAGDELLVMVARRLKQCLRVTDTVARLGGDEFAILLEDAKHPEDTEAVAERITSELRLPFALEGKEVFVGTSIGIVSSDQCDTAEELLRNADVAMYIAKSKGKGCYEIYEPHMHQVLVERMDLEADMRRALERDEFELHYQPIVVLRNGHVMGVEALLRWNHPTRGQIAPGAFIPIAEETGLIVPLGAWVLRRACQQAADWIRERTGTTPFSITVNVSGRQFRAPDLVETVHGAIADAGLEPGALILELTESVLMQHTEQTLDKLHAVRALGVRVAVDDFGTGYSSLSYLQRFPIDILKVDRSFVEGVGSGISESALARAILALGDTLRLQTVAEGVRTREQSLALQALGCELGQGFFFARPAAAASVHAMVTGQATFCFASAEWEARRPEVAAL